MAILSGSGRRPRVASDVVAKAVSWQTQIVHPIDHMLRVQLGVLVIWIGLVDGKLDCFGDAGREERQGSVLIGEELSSCLLFRLRIVVLDETAGAAHKVEAHQVAPVVGVLAEVEGSQSPETGLVASDELHLAQISKQALRADAQVLVLLHEDAKLVGQVQVSLVVRCR